MDALANATGSGRSAPSRVRKQTRKLLENNTQQAQQAERALQAQIAHDHYARKKFLRQQRLVARPPLCTLQQRSLPWYKAVNLRGGTPYSAAWDHRCSFCHALLLDVEANGWCCRKGRWCLPPLREYPPYFTHFLATNGALLQAYGRRLNNLFSFSAIGYAGKQHHYSNIPQNVVITGRVYHRMLNRPEEQGSLRWFLYDEQGHRNSGERVGIPAHLTISCRQLLEEHNPYIHTLRHAIGTVQGPDYEIYLQQPVAGGEVAAIVNPYNLQQVTGRRILVHRQGRPASDFVDILSLMYEPLQYPLFFPYADPGWSRAGSRQYTPQRTQRQWYRFRLLTEPRFAAFGSLMCEYLVDMYCRIEDETLQYIRHGRRLQVVGLQPQAHDQGQQSDQTLDTTFATSLPVSFLGSRAWASDKVADALALCRAKGKPTLFITMTTNPMWPEIQVVLKPGQHVADVPLVVCRAFKGRLAHLFRVLKRYFGTIVYSISVIEFQKRGLPHVHMLIKVSNPSLMMPSGLAPLGHVRDVRSRI